MTLEEAAARIGNRVIYRPFPRLAPEFGVITRVTELWVFVLYDGKGTPTATPSTMLEFEPEASALALPPFTEQEKDRELHPERYAEPEWEAGG